MTTQHVTLGSCHRLSHRHHQPRRHHLSTWRLGPEQPPGLEVTQLSALWRGGCISLDRDRDRPPPVRRGLATRCLRLPMLTLRRAGGGAPGQGLHWPHLWAGTVLGGPPRGAGSARDCLCGRRPWADCALGGHGRCSGKAVCGVSCGCCDTFPQLGGLKVQRCPRSPGGQVRHGLLGRNRAAGGAPGRIFSSFQALDVSPHTHPSQ